MTDFLYLTGVNDYRNGAGYLHGDTRPIRDFLHEQRPVTDWTPLVLTVKAGWLCDHQPNNAGCLLFSERLQSVLEDNRAEADILQWLPVTVVDVEEKSWPYWILHFLTRQDVLNKGKTLFVPGTNLVMKPYFDKALVRTHRVFSYPGAALALVVSSEVKQAIRQARCTGIEFSKALVI